MGKKKRKKPLTETLENIERMLEGMGYASRWYTLDENGQPVREPDMLAAARWMDQHPEQKQVAQTELIPGREYRWPKHWWVDDPTGFMGKRMEREVVENNGALVSTVFLGLDHDYTGKGPPVLWETMIFGIDIPGDEDGYDYQTRYSSREDALSGHKRAVNVARRVLQEQAARAAKAEKK